MERKGFIGGSDIASLFSIGYGCRRRLFYEKIGQEPDYPEDDNFNMRRGRLLEPVAAQMYAEETGRTVTVIPERIMDEELPYVGGLIDREIFDNAMGRGTLEIKCPSLRVYKEVKRSGMKEDYLLQGQLYNRINKTDYNGFANFSAELAELFHFDVLRDEELVKKVFEGIAAFWELLQRKDIPDKLPAKDKRCKTCKFGNICQGITQEEYEVLKAGDPDIIPVIDPVLASLIDEYWEVRTIAKEAGELFEECKERMKGYMEANKLQRAAAYGSKIYAVPTAPSMMWDGKALERDFSKDPEFMAKYRKPKAQSIPLRVYHIKG
jgi:CRISPR/Cas system-associated exonuclease Cas4 (RecB family)